MKQRMNRSELNITELNAQSFKLHISCEYFIGNRILVQNWSKVLTNYENEMKSYFNADLSYRNFNFCPLTFSISY
jgi:hypothetical protein